MEAVPSWVRGHQEPHRRGILRLPFWVHEAGQRGLTFRYQPSCSIMWESITNEEVGEDHE